MKKKNKEKKKPKIARKPKKLKKGRISSLMRNEYKKSEGKKGRIA